MVHYVLATEEQREFGEGVRQIADKMLKPRIEEYEAADGGFAFAFASAYAQRPNILKTHMNDEEKQAGPERLHRRVRRDGIQRRFRPGCYAHHRCL